jgi:hypothetical protein
MPSLPLFRRAAVSLALVLAACGSPTGPSLADVAGLYRLQAVNGRLVPDTAAVTGYGTLAGMIALRADGGAERSITYRDARGVLVPLAAVGSFEVRGGAVELKLRETDQTWRVRGDIAGGLLTLRYPNPGDGEIIERYRRE